MNRIFLMLIIGFLTTTAYGQPDKIDKSILDSLRVELETIFMEDQLFRRIYLDAEAKFGQNSAEMDYFWKVVEEQDERIEKQFVDIVETYGWLGISQVGRLANTAQFSVIQHGSIPTKKVFAPLFKASVLAGESQPIHYARLIDRMLINDDKPQIYGSETTTDKNGALIFFEIENPEYVNKRRKEIGLGSIEEFASRMQIIWNVEQKE